MVHFYRLWLEVSGRWSQTRLWGRKIRPHLCLLHRQYQTQVVPHLQDKSINQKWEILLTFQQQVVQAIFWIQPVISSESVNKNLKKRMFVASWESVRLHWCIKMHPTRQNLARHIFSVIFSFEHSSNIWYIGFFIIQWR